MPGHMLAAVSNYSGVACTDKVGWGNTFSSPRLPRKRMAMEFCKNVYSELIDLFPYKYVHIGGDEVEKANWKKCPDCQKRMRVITSENRRRAAILVYPRYGEIFQCKGERDDGLGTKSSKAD